MHECEPGSADVSMKGENYGDPEVQITTSQLTQLQIAHRSHTNREHKSEKFYQKRRLSSGLPLTGRTPVEKSSSLIVRTHCSCAFAVVLWFIDLALKNQSATW